MYRVTVNVDPNQIGPGEMVSIIGDAVRERIIRGVMEDTFKGLVKVEYESPESGIPE